MNKNIVPQSKPGEMRELSKRCVKKCLHGGGFSAPEPRDSNPRALVPLNPGCFMGILIMLHYNPAITWSDFITAYNPPKN